MTRIFNLNLERLPIFQIKILSALVVFTMLVTLPAFTQENKRVERELQFSLEDLLNVGMVSASKKKQSLQDAPATAYVITQEEIRVRGYQHLIELLEDIPEIEVQYNSNPQFRNQVTFRGVSGNEKILILLNNNRITPATGDYYPLSTNFSLVDAFRVEVIIGPASALYGVDAFGGIVNIITQNQDAQTQQGAHVQFSIGNFTTLNSGVTLGMKADRLLISGAFNQYYSAEPNLPRYYDISYDWYTHSYKPLNYVVETPYYGQVYDHVYMRKRAGNSFYGKDLSRNFEMPTVASYANVNLSFDKFTVGFVRHEEQHSTAWGLDPKYTAFERDQFFKQQNTTLYVRHTYLSFNSKWNLVSNMSHNFYDIDPTSNFIGSSTRWQRGFVYGKGQATKLEEQLSYEINTKNSIVAGASFENLGVLPMTGVTPSPIDTRIPLASQDLYYIGGAGYNPYAPDSLVGIFDSTRLYQQPTYQLEYQNLGTYLQWQRTGRKLDITVGCRYDNNTRYGDAINPRVGLVWSPNRKLKIKLLAGTAFLAPSPQKAYAQSGTFYRFRQDSLGRRIFFSDLFRVANDNLKPERLYSFEANLSYFITSNISLSLNTYYTHIQNMINFYGFADASLIARYQSVRSAKYEASMNEGQSDIFGFVPKINYLFNIGRVQLNSWASYHYIHSQYRAIRGNKTFEETLPFVSPTSAKMGVDIRYFRFFASLRGIYRSPSTSNQTILYLPPSEDETRIPNERIENSSFFIVNGNLGVNIKNKGKYKLALQLRCRNIFNTRYYHVTYGSDDSMGIAPQDPSRYNLTVQVKL